MSSFHALSRPVRVATAMLFVTFAAGCGHPLAFQHEFFAPLSGTADRIGNRARHAVSHHRALQAAQRACGSGTASALLPADEADLRGGTNSRFEAARGALADICATPVRPVAAHGAGSDAYRRWVEDQVRDLPGASETAASATGG